MKKFLSMLLVLCLLHSCLPVTAFAVVEDSGSCGNSCTWELDSDGVLTVRGTGMAWISGLGEETNSKIKHLVFEEGVTGFSCVFSLFVNMESIELPNTLTTIYESSFSNCPKLKSIVIPDSVASLGDRAFYGCSSLESVVLPGGITRIPRSCFEGCTSLTAINIPENFTAIGEYAFSGCTGLTSVTIPESVVTIENNAFENCTGLTDVTLCGTGNVSGAFSGCTALTTVTIQGGTNVGGFSGLPSLRTVNLSPGVTSIEDNAFSRCPSLASITLPEGVTSIGGSAFYECENLADVNLPNSLTSIGDGAFRCCGCLTSITLPDSVTSLGEYAFGDCADLASIKLSSNLAAISKGCFSNCSSLASIDIPSSVTALGEFAFHNCTGLMNVGFSEGLQVISADCFNHCSSLQSVTLPEGVTKLGGSAFSACQSLKSLYLPDSLTTISSGCFYRCDALEYLRLPILPASEITNGFRNNQNIKTIDFSGSIKQFEPIRTAFTKNGVTLSGTEIAYMGEPGGYQFTMTLNPGSGVLSGEHSFTVKKGNPCGKLPVPTNPDGLTFLGWYTQPAGGILFLSNTVINQSGDFTLYAHWTSGVSALELVAEGTPPLYLAFTGYYDREASFAGGHDYKTYGVTQKSALYENDLGGLTKVEYGAESLYGDKNVLVEEFDSNNALRGRLVLPKELPIWGGFFSGSRFNFLIFGQENRAEQDGTEVVRVVRYDKQWNRLDHCSLYGMNTLIPFSATGLRCAESGDYLIVHTAHTMYVSPDGLNHQANFTFTINQYSMELGTSRYLVAGPGLVGHSFNQFVLVNQAGRIVTLDHGDAYPRSILMQEYTASNPTQGRLGKSEKAVTIENLPGPTGENETGASVGGFAETTNGYVAAFNIDRDVLYGTDRNGYLAFVDKKTYAVKQVQLTTTKDCSTPILAPFGLDGGYVLWTNTKQQDGLIYYAWYDADGSVGKVQQAKGYLSACQPILHNGKATWCVRTGENFSTLTFYSLDRAGQLTSQSMQTQPEATPTPTPTPKPSFTDVPADSWYANAVDWAVANRITSGTGDGTTFSPNANCTRSQIVTFLWNAAGRPIVESGRNFKDVPADAWYANAVNWAVANRITSGTGDGSTFSPDAVCTRSQAVMFLWNAADKPVVSGGNSFTDVPANIWYGSAVNWAVANGITSGTGDGTTFSPGANCTRSQIVLFLYRAQ